MKQVTALSIAVLVVAGAAWLYFTRAEDGNLTASVGAAAPAFSLEDQTGKKVSLSDFSGKKIVVLEWINPDCPYVQRHYKAGTMKSLAQKYKDKGVIWLAINTTHYMNKETNQKWIADYQLPYQILDDHEGTVGRLYGAKTTPHMFIIDKSGKVVYQGAIDDDPRGNKGENKVNYVAKALDELLAGKPISMPQTKPYGCSVKFAK
ncbi:MAG: thioredoxin family protein [Acidobacteriota bacterium]|nr:thioredoxin family protein [Blastocatellia bacterium]MDW8239312.1 thioredoxin family protein [Acidobacteriota bacterium]